MKGVRNRLVICKPVCVDQIEVECAARDRDEADEYAIVCFQGRVGNRTARRLRLEGSLTTGLLSVALMCTVEPRMMSVLT